MASENDKKNAPEPGAATASTLDESSTHDRPSTSNLLEKRPHKDLIESFDRLVVPLDRILALMSAHATAQRRILNAIGAVAILVILAALYQTRLTAKLGQLEERLSAMSKTGEETKSKLAETERKVDESSLRALLAPELRVTTSPSGKANAVLVVRQAASVARASPSSEVRIPLDTQSARSE